MTPTITPAGKSIIRRSIVVLFGVLGYASFGSAQNLTISPPPFLLAQNNAGAIINNACIWTYNAGTTTPATTYSDNIGTQNSNPIRSDSAGRFTAFLVSGTSYKFVYESACTPPAHGTTLRTADNIAGTPSSAANVDFTCTAGETISAGQAVYLSDGSGAKTPGSCYKADSANTYSSTTPIIGMAPSAIASGVQGTVRLAGSVTGLSSLTIGSLPYYVGTAGAITTTPPTNARLVGVADTATSLVVVANPNANPPNADNSVQDFRLTLTTGTPITSADVTAATTIFFTPLTGNRIALANSAGVTTTYTSAEVSIAVPATTSQMYDVFAFSNSGVATLELLAWTNDTTRATALVRTTTGFLTKSGDLTRRYVGSVRTTTVSGQTEDSVTKRYVWNYYNRDRRALQRFESTASWSYNGVVRQANGATANQVDVVVGVAEATINLFLQTAAIASSASTFMSVGIGEDSTTTYTVGVVANQSVANTGFQNMACLLDKKPAIGHHFYAWNEFASATTTWIGASASGGSTITPGLNGFIEG